MGIYDRDYYRDPPHRSSFGGQVNPWSVTTWIIAINVVVYLLDQVLLRQGIGYQRLLGVDAIGNRYFAPPTGPLDHWGYFSIDTAVLAGQAWRLVTFQFLHASFSHILFNMIGLFFFGPMVEAYLGRRRYLAFYLLCGAAGPVAYMLLWAGHLLGDGAATPLVGASAGIFGVLIAGAAVAPDTMVLVYGVLPVKLRTFALILLGIAAYTIFTSGHNAGGQAAHLGGAVAGFLLIRNPTALNWANGPGGRRPMRYRR